jgi:uncharacterized protein (TIGR00730 family)
MTEGADRAADTALPPDARPKPAADDPEAPQRVAAIMASAAYLEADSDTEFLQRGDTRGVRLQIDYLKAELQLRAHGIRHTVVVFGSTRLMEPAAARRNVDVLRAEAEARPGDAEFARRLAVAERLLENSRYYDVARQFGRLVSTDCGAGRMTVVTGGGPGIMEAANRGAFDAGAPSVGLNIALPREQYPNPYITPDLCLRFHYFAVRKLHFLLRARALVAFPGGYGTLDELFETLALVQTGSRKPLPVVLVGEAFWRRAIDVDFLADEGMIAPEDRGLFSYAETAEEIVATIARWPRADTPSED